MKSDNHDWTTEQVLYLSQLRDKCLQRARDNGYDYVYMVDGDVIPLPGTLRHLIKLSEGEHVTSTGILCTWDKWERFAFSTNYAHEISKDGYKPIQVKLDRVAKDFKEQKPIEVPCAYMIWCIPKKVLDKVCFYEKSVYQFDFKVFSKKCRDNNIKQIVDFKYPATHLEKSGIVLKYVGE